MTSHTLQATVLASLLVLAGCAGGIGPGAPTSPTTSNPDADMGAVNFYISDERNAIGDFEHLNVTITQVGFVREDADNESATASQEETTTAQPSPTTTESTTNTTETTMNSTQTAPMNTSTPTVTTNESDENGDESAADRRVTRAVDNVTIDLTAYQGANATLLSEFSVPNGSYTQAFISVSAINGTLTTGESVDVKLPSNTLRLNHDFTVGSGETVDFVFDVTVFAAGNSGMYILKPVASESGTDVPITAAGERVRGPPEEAGESDDERNTSTQDGLAYSIDGSLEPGATVTLTVRLDGEPVRNAQIRIAGEQRGQTDADGTITVTLPTTNEAVMLTIQARGERLETTLNLNASATSIATTSG